MSGAESAESSVFGGDNRLNDITIYSPKWYPATRVSARLKRFALASQAFPNCQIWEAPEAAIVYMASQILATPALVALRDRTNILAYPTAPKAHTGRKRQFP